MSLALEDYMPLLQSFLLRVLISVSVVFIAAALVLSGTAPFLALGLVDAATSLPFFLLGSLLWGPKGFGARYYGVDTTKVWLPSLSLRHGLALVSIGTVMTGHFSQNPQLASFGFLAGLIALEMQITTYEYVRHTKLVKTNM
ncbi:MAG: hypothetical protein ACK5T1_08875 [Betaproteobacteria bacterium]